MNKRELARVYKETARPMGIYRVHNTLNERSLVGRSVDLPSILNRVRTQLKFGGHPNRELQREWNAQGPDAFAFEVLDTLTPPDDSPGYAPSDDLRTLEAMWMERLEPFDERGYHSRPPRP